MLCIYMQRWFWLSDPAMEEAHPGRGHDPSVSKPAGMRALEVNMLRVVNYLL